MKTILISFTIGVIAASAAWYSYTRFLESKYALAGCAHFADQAEVAKRYLQGVSTPSEDADHRLVKSALVLVKGWLAYVDMVDEKFPATRARERLATQYMEAEAVLSDWGNWPSNKPFQDSVVPPHPER